MIVLPAIERAWQELIHIRVRHRPETDVPRVSRLTSVGRVVYERNVTNSLTEDVTATVQVSIKVGKEMRAHALRKGIGLEEIENAAGQKLQEIMAELAGILGVEYED